MLWKFFPSESEFSCRESNHLQENPKRFKRRRPIYPSANDQPRSLGVDSVPHDGERKHPMCPIPFTFEGAAHEYRRRRQDTFPVNSTSSTVVGQCLWTTSPSLLRHFKPRSPARPLGHDSLAKRRVPRSLMRRRSPSHFTTLRRGDIRPERRDEKARLTTRQIGHSIGRPYTSPLVRLRSY